MKKVVIPLLALCLLCITTISAANSQIKLIVDGKVIQSDVPPQEIDGRVLVPARALAESLGATVTWNEEYQTVHVISGKQSAPVNPSGKIEVAGPPEFVAAINGALATLQRSPGDYSLVSQFIAKIDINEAVPVFRSYPSGMVSCNWPRLQREISMLDSNQKNIITAGFLVHEAYHVYFARKVITMPLIEEEVLAYTRQRQVLNRLGATSQVKNSTSVDMVIDTNYFGKL